jgi:hypothetical protein
VSFSFSFTAKSDYSARQQLHEVTAPAAVKALVEQALAGIKWPEPKMQAGAADKAELRGGAIHGAAAPIRREREVFGVIVEAWGHIGGENRKFSGSSSGRCPTPKPPPAPPPPPAAASLPATARMPHSRSGNRPGTCCPRPRSPEAPSWSRMTHTERALCR